MLFRYLFIAASAIAAASASASSGAAPGGNGDQAPIVNPDLPVPGLHELGVCPPCSPCRVNCVCPETHVSDCSKPTDPRDPREVIVCCQGCPCTSKCICKRASIREPGGGSPISPKDGRPRTPEGKPICAEFASCTSDCVCSMESLRTYLKVDELSPKTIICPQGQCNDNCVCRERLVESLHDLLFPKEKNTTSTSATDHSEL